ncbi:TetR/AcrR family transcriptional regulator C-terminal domain-containing protein [Saccharothrix coeruleofusca]|uniref:TetR family transcriptional regulator n=1 Tax=Saccharothrix coeruleofusca TaxID=33919 RepID=A0A918ASR2_9PSEU|nr:TetR/AcrR family transcriptional regulator C-terminal domain-containing protein [Saccharothrix coeruleofusca]MBP2336814.1 TetR/AcrR family tetracycline transcriptional repressor [Saccharothrix coeruleofusca]GGP82757.1 TetR family transcriptional regulator [Saccharothrix coeruleofusca]
MTNKQAGRPSPPRLDRDTVVSAALALLDEAGLEAVSTRAVAARLGVRMNTVLWHVKSKARLRELMADAILAQVALNDLPEHWRDRAAELPRRLRHALLAHRDGAATVIGTYTAEPGTLRFAEELVAALLAGGVDDRRAAWTTWSLLYLTLGLVHEEQAQPEPGDNRLAEALSRGGYPALDSVHAHLAPGAFAQRLDFALDQVLGQLP